MASCCSIVNSEANYIGFTLLTTSQIVNNTELSDPEPELLDPYPNLSPNDAIELRKHGIVKKGPKSKKQGWDLSTEEKDELKTKGLLKDWERERNRIKTIEDRREYLQTAELVRDPRNWFDLVSEHKTIEKQFRDRKFAILKKEEESRLAYEKRLAETFSPLDKEWDYSQ